MADKETQKIVAAFGKEFDISELEGIDIKELLDVNTDLLKIEGGDPNYEYGWMDVRDPMHSYKLRKGLWEQVDAQTDSVVCAGSIKEGGSIRVNELMLVRMPKEKRKRMLLAVSAVSIAKQSAIQDRFPGEAGAIAKQFHIDEGQVAAQAKTTEKVGVKVEYKGKEQK